MELNVFSCKKVYNSTACGDRLWQVSARGRRKLSKRTLDSSRDGSFSKNCVSGTWREGFSAKERILKRMNGKYGWIKLLRQTIRFSIALTTRVNRESAFLRIDSLCLKYYALLKTFYSRFYSLNTSEANSLIEVNSESLELNAATTFSNWSKESLLLK